jgi:hypothetical protein
VRHGRSVSCAWEVAVPEDMERSTTTCPCAADMPGAENMPVPGFHADRRWGRSASPARPAARSTRSPHSDGGSRGGAMP